MLRMLWLEPSPGLLTDVTTGTLSPKKVQMTVKRGEAVTPQPPDTPHPPMDADPCGMSHSIPPQS